MIKLIDTFSYRNRLRHTSPIWKCTFAAVLFIFAYLSHPIVQIAIMLWMCLWTVAYARTPIKHYLLLIGVPCLFFAASLPAIIIEVQPLGDVRAEPSETILFNLAHWVFSVAERDLFTAGELFARVVACLSCTAFITLTVPVTEWFQVLQKLRVPALVLELMLIMYRFLFLLLDTASRMYTAQLARGGHASFRRKLIDMSVLVVRLFDKTMQRYKGLSYGLTARGFTEDIRMAPYAAKPMPLRYQWEGRIGIGILLFIEAGIRWREMI